MTVRTPPATLACTTSEILLLAPPATVPREQDVIQKTLNAIGVTYSHMNDDILVPSKIEAERTKQSLLVS